MSHSSTESFVNDPIWEDIGFTNEYEDPEEVKAMESEILALEQQLKDSREQHQQTTERRVLLSQELRDAKLLNDAVNERINSLGHEHVLLKEHYDAMMSESKRVEEKVQSLTHINALNDAFFIWYTGSYSTINNFRLGSVNNPSNTSNSNLSSLNNNVLTSKQQQPLDWLETNTAFGQALLAIDTVSQLIKYQFQKYSLQPMGSFSSLIKLDDKSKTLLPLYIDTSISFSLFPKRNFNNALTGLLTCIHELGIYTQAIDPTLSLPYEININDMKISDINVLLGYSDDESWTKAMKYMLTDIKWILTWTVKHLS